MKKATITYNWKEYIPLIIIFGLLVVISCTISLKDVMSYSFSVEKTIRYFMIGFFLIFAGFKLLDLSQFAKGYATYDLLAKHFKIYGYLYPFIELFFGLGMILFPYSKELLYAEIIIMLFSGIGVALKLAKREPIQCACLGTFLKVPLTKITLFENFGMALLGIVMILLS